MKHTTGIRTLIGIVFLGLFASVVTACNIIYQGDCDLRYFYLLIGTLAAALSGKSIYDARVRAKNGKVVDG